MAITFSLANDSYVCPDNFCMEDRGGTVKLPSVAILVVKLPSYGDPLQLTNSPANIAQIVKAGWAHNVVMRHLFKIHSHYFPFNVVFSSRLADLMLLLLD